MSSTRQTGVPRWTAAALACGLFATAPIHSTSIAEQPVGSTGYRPASELHPRPPLSSYLPPPRQPEREGFSIAELRAAATGVAHDGYVDLGRFRALRREASAP